MRIYGLRRTAVIGGQGWCTGQPDRPRVPTRFLARALARFLSRGDVVFTVHRDYSREWRAL